MNKPFFSVVIPVHNKEPHIERSISSVLAQSFSNFEVLIIDDASTDNSVAEIEKFDDERISIFHRETPGPGGYAARNLGIEKANSDWITFLDADDEWSSTHLESYYDLISKHPNEQIFLSGYKNIFPENSFYSDSFNKYYLVNKENDSVKFNFKEYLKSELSGSSPFWTSIVCIEKKLIIQAGAFPEGQTNRGGDVDTWLRCIELAGSALWSNHMGAIYYRDSINMVTRTASDMGQCERNTVRSLLEKYFDNEIKKLLKKFANRRTINAWKLNKLIDSKLEFHLVDKLYFSVNPFKNTLYVFISILPSNIYLGTRMLVKETLKKYRTFFKGV